MTNKEIFKKAAYDSLEKQVGGKHYKNMKIQPAEFINENKLLFAEGNAIKYICRHSLKGGMNIYKTFFSKIQKFFGYYLTISHNNYQI